MPAGARAPRADKGAVLGSVAVPAGDGEEAPPREISADMLFFGTPIFSFFEGVPLDLVVTPIGYRDSRTGCSPESSSSERMWRRSI